MTHVESVKVVMLSDFFLLPFKLLQETQLVVRMTQDFKVCSGRVYFFSVTFLCQMAGGVLCCKVNHNYLSESIFQHVLRKQAASVFCICGTHDM